MSKTPTYSNELQNLLVEKYDISDKDFVALIKIVQQATKAAEVRGAAFAIEVIDDLHLHTNSDLVAHDDKIYKSIKNAIRDRYKFVHGTDPAPNYPVQAQLPKEEDGE